MSEASYTKRNEAINVVKSIVDDVKSKPKAQIERQPPQKQSQDLQDLDQSYLALSLLSVSSFPKVIKAISQLDVNHYVNVGFFTGLCLCFLIAGYGGHSLFAVSALIMSCVIGFLVGRIKYHKNWSPTIKYLDSLDLK